MLQTHHRRSCTLSSPATCWVITSKQTNLVEGSWLSVWSNIYRDVRIAASALTMCVKDDLSAASRSSLPAISTLPSKFYPAKLQERIFPALWALCIFVLCCRENCCGKVSSPCQVTATVGGYKPALGCMCLSPTDTEAWMHQWTYGLAPNFKCKWGEALHLERWKLWGSGCALFVNWMSSWLTDQVHEALLNPVCSSEELKNICFD